MCDGPMYTQAELELLSDLLGTYLETDDLSHAEWAIAKVLLEQIDGML